VEIEIDPVSLKPLVRGIWLAAEGGKILSQDRARRSLKIAAINALHWSCREDVIYENGIIPPEIIQYYGLVSPEEVPPIHIDFLLNDNAAPKGIGELPYSCVPAAYVQAVSQAMDHPFEKIPLSARDVWDVEENKKVVIRS
jgi:CO/xanthine dehydrogenase Mo-binding subunit